MPGGPHPPQGAQRQPSGPHPGDAPQVGSAPHLRGKIPHLRTNRAAGRGSSPLPPGPFSGGRASFGRLNRATVRSLLPGGREGNRTELFASASGSFSGDREESFHPCVRASFGRLNRATGRSLLPGGREGGRRLSGPPFRCRAEGAAQNRRKGEGAKVGNNPQKI